MILERNSILLNGQFINKYMYFYIPVNERYFSVKVDFFKFQLDSRRGDRLYYFYEDSGKLLDSSCSTSVVVHVTFTRGNGSINWQSFKNTLIQKKPAYGKCLSDYAINFDLSATDLKTSRWLVDFSAAQFAPEKIKELPNGDWFYEGEEISSETISFWIKDEEEKIAQGETSNFNLWIS